MNNWNGIGNFVRDCEFKTTEKTNVLRGTIAVERKFKNNNGEKEADFINLVFFGKLAEVVNTYSGKKGNKIGVTGEIRTGSYEGKDGKKVYTTDIFVSDATFINTEKRNTVQENNNFDATPVNDSDIPF